jgi:hypothetical protein
MLRGSGSLCCSMGSKLWNCSDSLKSNLFRFYEPALLAAASEALPQPFIEGVSSDRQSTGYLFRAKLIRLLLTLP